MRIERLELRSMLSATVVTVAPPPPSDFAVSNGEMLFNAVQEQSPPADHVVYSNAIVVPGIDQVASLAAGIGQAGPMLQPWPAGNPTNNGIEDSHPSAAFPPDNVAPAPQVPNNAQMPATGANRLVMPGLPGPGADMNGQSRGMPGPGSVGLPPPLLFVEGGVLELVAPPPIMMHGSGVSGPFTPSVVPSISALVMATTATTTASEGDRLGGSEIASHGAVTGTAAVTGASSTTTTPGSLAVKGENAYRLKNAVDLEIGFSQNADDEPGVWGDMAQVDRAASVPSIPTDELQSAAFLDIAAPDAALQSPSELAGVAAATVISHGELAVDRVMGQTSGFPLDSANGVLVVAQHKAGAQDGATAIAGQAATTQAPAVSKASVVDRHHGDAPGWPQRAATGATFLLFAFQELLFGKRRRQDNDDPRSRKPV